MINDQSAQEAVKFLGKCLLFRALDDRARQELASRLRHRQFKSGEPIFHVGAPGQSMMVILKGTVRVSLPGPSGKTVILADLSQGDIVGEVALLDGKGRSADATALTNCLVAALERRDVLPFLEKRPDVCLKLLELMCARLRKSDERMSEIAFFELPARLAKVLLERIGEAGGGTPRLSLSQSELAGMINASRENVNRCLRDWQRRGLVSLDERWISVLQRAALGAIASPF
ncbi:MAG TPA: Crp/Fnr family transcriptional regulator [Stellaceae bacterium]|nr:Crp/Fnr family transcriptional regulator [Stellaceae bacterium]